MMTAKSPTSKALTQKRAGALAKLSQIQEGHVKSSDGTKIYFRSVGQGTPIVLCNGMGVSVFFWKYFESHFKQNFQVITWDYRGHGDSQLPKDKKNVSVDFLVQDCLAVCKHFKIHKAILVGHSLGTQVALEFYRHYPKLVAGIVSCFGTFGRPMDFFYNSRVSKYVFEILSGLNLMFPRQSSVINNFIVRNPLWYQLGGLLKMINTTMARKSDAQEYIDHLLSIDPEFLASLSRSVQSHSAEDVLKEIKVPTLIVGGDEDNFTPIWLAKKMHRLIANSELFVIRRGSHAALVEQPELINLRVEKFIRERVLTSLENAEKAKKKHS